LRRSNHNDQPHALPNFNGLMPLQQPHTAFRIFIGRASYELRDVVHVALLI
jgi:hypothetical protein